jgi:hypothetical protein
MKYAYITTRTFSNGEIAVQARRSNGTLIFGFRVLNTLGWREQARACTPEGYVPVFQANKPAELRA